MTKKFPQIEVRTLIKVLLKLGYVERRQAGSHKIFRHPKNKIMIVVPFHNRDLKKGLLLGIIKQLGISREDFLNLL